VRTRRKLIAAFLALATFSGVGVIAPPEASAYPYGNVYLVVGNWNCVGGGKVTGVFGAVDQVWTGGDWGNNIIYPRVDLNRTNTFNGRAYCDRPWYQGPDYWINVTWWRFYPTRTGQTFWY
jgi:hypothetical protein